MQNHHSPYPEVAGAESPGVVAMSLIPTRVHGVLDYLVGILLLVAPWPLGFPHQDVATAVPVALGAAAIVYSLLTDYEWGLVPALPMPVHLLLDAASGVVLAASPWLFGFADIVWAPHLIVGLFEVGAAALTSRAPSGRSLLRPRMPGGLTR